MAGGKGTSYANAWLLLVFNATAFANIAQNHGTAPNTAIEVALSTGTLDASSNQSTTEATYTSYQRVAHPRQVSSGWTVTSNSVSPTPASPITFPAGTGGSGTVTYFSAGRDHTGTGLVFYWGPVTPNIVTGNGVTPQLSTSTAITEA